MRKSKRGEWRREPWSQPWGQLRKRRRRGRESIKIIVWVVLALHQNINIGTCEWDLFFNTYLVSSYLILVYNLHLKLSFSFYFFASLFSCSFQFSSHAVSYLLLSLPFQLTSLSHATRSSYVPSSTSDHLSHHFSSCLFPFPAHKPSILYGISAHFHLLLLNPRSCAIICCS